MIDGSKLTNKGRPCRTITIPAGKASEQEAWIRGHVTDPHDLSTVVHQWLVMARPHMDAPKSDPDLPEMEVVL